MVVDREELKDVLRLFPSYILRDVIDERGLGTTSNKKEELVEGIATDEWSDEEFQQLQKRLSDVKLEDQPLMRYIFTIEEGDSFDEVLTAMEANPVEFDDEDLPEQGGFEIRSVGEAILQATEWKKRKYKEYVPVIDRIRERTDIQRTDFIIDLEERRVFVESTNYGKATHIWSLLDNHGFELGRIGHRNLQSDAANERVKAFVRELKSQEERQ